MMIAAGRDERRLGAESLHQFETEHVAIELQRAVDIGDSQMNMADAGAGIDRRRRLTDGRDPGGRRHGASFASQPRA